MFRALAFSILLIACISILVVAVFVYIFFDFVSIEQYAANQPLNAIVTIVHDGSSVVAIIIRPDTKPMVRKIVSTLSGVIYREATLYNPPGDRFPDVIDDTIKEYIRQKIQ